VRVSATLVKHAPAAPAFGFRFDSHHGSVVFSGDTGVCDNLVRLATGADVLVHEVVDVQWIRGRYGQPPYTPDQEALINHHLTAHTPVADTGRVAERAGVPTLVLNHFVPGNIPESRWAQARKTYSGRLIVGRDLDRIGVGRPAR
jgi:ribonuclease BN (tRNA processing enzyme)